MESQQLFCAGGRGDALHRRVVGRDQLDHLRPPTPASANLLRGSRTHDLSQVATLYNSQTHLIADDLILEDMS